MDSRLLSHVSALPISITETQEGVRLLLKSFLWSLCSNPNVVFCRMMNVFQLVQEDVHKTKNREMTNGIS